MNSVRGFTLSGKGYYRWYKGRTRWVCSKATPDDEVEDRWYEAKKYIDRGHNGRPPCLSNLRELISDFITAAEQRVQTGKPKPLRARTLHNYITDLNQFGAIVGGGVKVEDISPQHFVRYTADIQTLARSGYDSKVAHVRALFSWAEENEYIDRVRFGTALERPGKQAIRDERIERPRSFTPAEIALLIDRSSGAMRPMLMLGIAGALNNSEVAWLERGCVDLETGILDFRRRKHGRVRRVIPLPEDIVAELRSYVRPEPRDPAHADLFFITADGNPYVHMTAKAQANTITKLFRDLASACGVKDITKGHADHKGFAGLRTSFVSMAPPGYREEVEILVGHARGTILLDHYVEGVGLDRLRHVVDSVWGQVRPLLRDHICRQLKG